MVSLRSLRHLPALAAALLLAACGAVTQLAYSNAALAYSNLPPMMAWAVDDYVDMSGGQKEWVRGRIERLMYWHRTSELPQYRRFLERALSEAAEPFTIAEIREAWQELRALGRRTMEQALPDVADFLVQLDAGQVAQLERKFADDDRKFVRESLKGTPEERHGRRVKRFAYHLEGWLGDLTDAQRALIDAHYRSIPDFVEDRLAERRLRHAETMSLLRGRASREQVIAGLRRLVLEADAWRRPEYRDRLDDRERRFFEMLAALSATLTAEQRSHLQGRIRGYMRDITTLSAERGPRPSS